MACQYAPDQIRAGYTIQQIADRFEVYARGGRFIGEHLLRASAEHEVAVLERAHRNRELSSGPGI